MDPDLRIPKAREVLARKLNQILSETKKKIMLASTSRTEWKGELVESGGYRAVTIFQKTLLSRS